MSIVTKSSFLEQIMGNSPKSIHFETWAWTWSWTWKALWTWGTEYCFTKPLMQNLIFTKYCWILL